MKIRHGVIISLALFIGAIIIHDDHQPINEQKLTNIVLILWLASLGLVIYLIIRSIFQAIKKTDKVTPKQKQDTTPPWEK